MFSKLDKKNSEFKKTAIVRLWILIAFYPNFHNLRSNKTCIYTRSDKLCKQDYTITTDISIYNDQNDHIVQDAGKASLTTDICKFK